MAIAAHIESRFWAKVQKTRCCWEWSGSTDKRKGYGFFWFPEGRPRNIGAHRFAWILAHGPIPNGLFVCHHCDNPGCVRPDHLFLGTHADNMRDASSKGRLTGGFSREEAALRKIHPERSPRMAARIRGVAQREALHAQRTARASLITAFRASGATNREIAEALGISMWLTKSIARRIRQGTYPGDVRVTLATWRLRSASAATPSRRS